MRYSKYAASLLSQRIVNKTVAGSRSDKSRACLEYINKLLVQYWSRLLCHYRMDAKSSWFVQTRQAMYDNVTLRCVRVTIVAVEKQYISIYITYSECVFVDLGMQHAICVRFIVICGLPGFTIFFYIIS